MLVSLGRSGSATDLVGSLRACHARIRHFAEQALQVAIAVDAPPHRITEAAAEVRRYFVEAMPLHVADEEETIAPLLRGRDPAVDAALARMVVEHRTHDAPLAAMTALCERIADGADGTGDARRRLAVVAVDVRRELEEHLAQEEAIVLPAIERLLSGDEKAAVQAAMRARRQGSGARGAAG